MIFQGLALAGLLSQCAPDVAPSTMAAIVQVESGGDPWAIDDDTTHRSYHPVDRESAQALARNLIAQGHQIDVGLGQIDSDNFPALGVGVGTIFDPCTNINAGSKILTEDYRLAVHLFGPGAAALRRALGMYNTGRFDKGANYADRVFAAGRDLRSTESAVYISPDRDAMHAPVLVRAFVVRPKTGEPERGTAAPARAPILVTIPRPSQVIFFDQP